VAQLGSALDWGSRGRRFKSCRPDGRRELVVLANAQFSGLSLVGGCGQHDLHRRLLGTHLGPAKVFREQFRRVAHRLPVRMQVPLRRRQRPVASDLPQVVERHSSICHPGQPGVPQIVASKVLVAELSDGFVPVGCIAKHRGGGYPASTRPGEETGDRAPRRCGVRSSRDLWDQRNSSSAFALRALVDEPARRRSGLSTYRPLPRGCVDVANTDTGDLADPGGSDRTEDDDVAPTRVVIR
jgi:hypothetical protein